MRLIIVGVVLLGLIVVGALVAPSFIDWNKYKPQIVTAVEKATGLEMTLNGDLSVAVLPSPRVKIEDLTIVAPQKKEFDNLLTIKSASVSVALLPLLSQEFNVSSVTLIEPVIRVEILENGTPSWQTVKLGGQKKSLSSDLASTQSPNSIEPEAGNVSASQSIALDKLEIEKGDLIYVDHQSGSRYEVADVNAVLRADSLDGPFAGRGDIVYQGQKIEFDVQTGSLKNKASVPVKARIALPKADSEIDFDGVAALGSAIDVQGQVDIQTKSISDVMALAGGTRSQSLDVPFTLNGLVSATQKQVKVDNLNIVFDSLEAKGRIDVQNIDSFDPMLVKGTLQSSSVLDVNKFTKAAPKKKENGSGGQGKSQESVSKSGDDIVPGTLALPFPIDADVTVDLGGVKIQDTTLKGVFVDLDKVGKTAKAAFKVLEMPGQGKASGDMTVSYASASKESLSGAFIYSDPSVTYKVNGQVGQLDAFLKAFAPDADTKAVTRLYKTAQFNLNGSVNNNAFALKDSTVKLDELVIGLGGKYQPVQSNGRAKAEIDVSAGTINLDQLSGGKPANASSGGGSGGASNTSPEKALEPVKNFSLPLDLKFDVSLQEAVTNGQRIKGVRVVGDVTGDTLTLEKASANDFAGAVVSAAGTVGSLQNLSGLDVSASVKTQDLPKLANALKLDLSQFPANLKVLDAAATGKGTLDALSFSTNVKALGGELDAAGLANNVLKTPSYKDLSVRVKHPNLVKVIQIFSPEFEEATGLQQAIDFFAKIDSDGKRFDLSEMAVKLGQTDFKGNLSVTPGDVTAVKGTINAGRIALDSFTGGSAKSGASSSGSGGGSSASSSGRSGKWSTDPINLDWMKTVDVDVNLSADTITHGKWNFAQPSTSLRIANGKMTVSDMKAGVFGGSATLSSVVTAEPVSVDVSTSMNGINLESLAGALSGSNRLKAKGTVSFTADVKGAGASEAALISNLNGKADLDGKDVLLQGFDLAKLAQGLSVDQKLATSLQNFSQAALSGGETRFDTIKGDYNIQNGVVRIQSMQMDGPAAVIDSTGTADLPKWYINVDNLITLKDVEDLKPLEVKIKGPIDNPSDTFGKNILEDYIQDKVRRKIGKEIPGLLGDDASNALQKLGIIPQQQQPAPQAAPVEQAPAEDPAAQPVQEAPAEEQPRRIEKPEDAVNELLNGGNVESLIEGLF